MISPKAIKSVKQPHAMFDYQNNNKITIIYPNNDTPMKNSHIHFNFITQQSHFIHKF